MSTISNYKTRQRGFGILEVLITVAILSIALLSLGGLHALIIQSSSEAKARGVATSLASEKLDDLRSFGTLDSSGNPVGSGFDYDTIDSDAGGNSGNTLTVENVTFNREWTVHPLFLCTENGAPSLTNSCGKTTPDMKLVNVVVYWDDKDGVRQNVALQSTISWVAAGAAGQGLQASPNQGPEKVLNTNYNASDQDISLDLGDVLKRVSQPVPDTNRGNNDNTSNTITTFHEEFFDGYNRLLGENEFVTLNCYCNQLGTPGNNDTFYGLEPTILQDNKYIAGNQNANKRRGTPASGGAFNDQPAACKVCCRDHHDDSTQTEKFDPFKPSTDYGSSSIRTDHNHYAPGTNAGTLANSNNDQYAEACRMAWVDGRLRVLQDWRLESLVILQPSFLSTSSNITLYTNYVAAFVTEFIKAIDNSYPSTMPRRSTILATSNVATAKALLPSSYTMSSSPQNMTVRGTYIDYMSIDLINTIRCKMSLSSTLLTGGTESTCSGYGVTATGDFLHLIPFHDVNLTKLAQWTSSNGSNISVTSDSLLDQTESSFSRGKITGVATGTRACISAKINISNTGLTVTESIDPEDASSSLTSPTETVNPISDKMPVTYGSSNAADPCTTSPSTRITGTVSTNASTTGGLQPADVYITVRNENGTTDLCYLTVASNGSYDTDSNCSSQLSGATGLKLYIWHYTHRTSGNTYDNCVLNTTSPIPYSGTPSSANDGVRCTGGSCSSTDFVNTGSEHAIFPFSGLTAGSTTTFNFTINQDSASSSQCTTSN